MSDYNCIDVIREAQATVVAAAQSSTSFVPPLGRESARVFTLNLRNRLIFKAADEEGAVESADFLGRQRVIKKSWGYSGGQMSRNYSEQEEHKIKPHLLRDLANTLLSSFTASAATDASCCRRSNLMEMCARGFADPFCLALQVLGSSGGLSMRCRFPRWRVYQPLAPIGELVFQFSE